MRRQGAAGRQAGRQARLGSCRGRLCSGWQLPTACLHEALICTRLPIWASRGSLGLVILELCAAGIVLACSRWRRLTALVPV